MGGVIIMAVSGRLSVAMVVKAMRVVRRGLVGGVVVTMVPVGRGRSVIVVCGVAVIVMGGRSRGGMIVVSMIGMGRSVIIVAVSGGRCGMVVMPMVGVGGSMAMVVMTVGRGGRIGGVVIVTVALVMSMTGLGTVSGVRAMARAMAGICGVIAVRLMLVAHCDSVPQPLSAVFAAKSV